MNKENQEWENRLSVLWADIAKEDRKYLLFAETKRFIKQELSKAREEEREKFQTIIKLRLKYCQEQNGLPYCKNCGLKETDAIKQIEK